MVEVEAGAATNEPVTYAVRKAIELGVVHIIEEGEEKGLWKFKPLPIPEQVSLEMHDEAGDDQPITMAQLEDRVADYHARVAEAVRLAEEIKVAEAARIAEEARLAEEANAAFEAEAEWIAKQPKVVEVSLDAPIWEVYLDKSPTVQPHTEQVYIEVPINDDR